MPNSSASRRVRASSVAVARRAGAALVALALALAGPAALAQGDDAAPVAAPTAVLVVDMQRIKSDTAAGRDMLAKTVEIRRRIQAGIEEREAALREEERRLAEERGSLGPGDFRERVRAFEQQVIDNRAFSERESRRLQLVLSRASGLLRDRVTAVLAAIMRERGAELLLDSTQIVLSADRLDITDEAIGRLDAVMPEMPVTIVDVPDPD